MHAKLLELAVEIEVNERAVGGGCDARFQCPACGCYTGSDSVISRGFDIGRIINVEDIDVSVDASGGGLAGAGAGIAGEYEKTPVSEVLNFRLSGHLQLLGRVGYRGIIPVWKRDNVLGHVLRGSMLDVILQKPRLAAERVVRAAFLIQCGLHEGVECMAVLRYG